MARLLVRSKAAHNASIGLSAVERALRRGGRMNRQTRSLDPTGTGGGVWRSGGCGGAMQRRVSTLPSQAQSSQQQQAAAARVSPSAIASLSLTANCCRRLSRTSGTLLRLYEHTTRATLHSKVRQRQQRSIEPHHCWHCCCRCCKGSGHSTPAIATQQRSRH